MCSYITETTELTGSAKSADGWTKLSRAVIYVDHPYFTSLEQTLNVDLVTESGSTRKRLALELSLESAEELIACMQRALRTAQPNLSPST
jgi:uncharacterized protein DUF6295